MSGINQAIQKSIFPSLDIQLGQFPLMDIALAEKRAGILQGNQNPLSA
jgi:hypothetical protein